MGIAETTSTEIERKKRTVMFKGWEILGYQKEQWFEYYRGENTKTKESKERGHTKATKHRTAPKSVLKCKNCGYYNFQMQKELHISYKQLLSVAFIFVKILTFTMQKIGVNKEIYRQVILNPQFVF